MDFWNSFGTEEQFEAAMGKPVSMKTKGLYGGRAGTRTPDLLRVKQTLQMNGRLIG